MNRIGRRGTAGKVLLAACATIALVLAALLGGAAAPAQAVTSDDEVLDWNLYAAPGAHQRGHGHTAPGAGQPPPVSALHLGMVQGAVYDAVNMIDGGHEPYLDGLPRCPVGGFEVQRCRYGCSSRARRAAGPEATRLAAAATQATIDWLNATYTRPRSVPGTGSRGRCKGARGCSRDARKASGRGRAIRRSLPSIRLRRGAWGSGDRGQRSSRGSDPGPGGDSGWVKDVDPFVLEKLSRSARRALTGSTRASYAKEYNEVKELGGNGTTTPSARTQAQTDLAWFFTVNPAPMYYASFRAVAKAEGLSLVEQARLFGLLGLSGADSFINCWNDKAHYSFWRPITAIRLGDSDTNAETVGDASWTSLVPAPAYPDHPSGYNCITGALLHTAKAFFGNGTSFTLNATPTIAGAPTPMTRTYRHFTDVPEDTIVARMYHGHPLPDARRARRGAREACRQLGRGARARAGGLGEAGLARLASTSPRRGAKGSYGSLSRFVGELHGSFTGPLRRSVLGACPPPRGRKSRSPATCR